MMTHHNKTLKCFMVYCIIAVISKYAGMVQLVMQHFLLQQKFCSLLRCNPTLDTHCIRHLLTKTETRAAKVLLVYF